MEQLLPLPLIEAPASAKLHVLLPCTPRATSGDGCAVGSATCDAPYERKEEPTEGEPHHEINGVHTCRKRSRPVPAEAAGGVTHSAYTAARYEGAIKGKVHFRTLDPRASCTPPSAPADNQQQPTDKTAPAVGTAACTARERQGVQLEAEAGKHEGNAPPLPQDSTADANPVEDFPWEEFKSIPFNSLSRAVFRCLQDLRSEGGASTDGGPREPGRFANHVLNILDARDREDLAPYLQIFSVCLRQGRAPCSLSGDARQLMLEALAALEATGYSVHVKQVFAEYSRVVRTLRRRDVLLAPLCNSAHSNNGKLPRGALLHLAAAAGPEDAELADLWVNASLGDPHMQEACGDGPHATACRSGGRPQEYLLQCKDIIVRQLRALRRLVPVWAARDRAYQYHLDAVLTARTPGELVKYLIILSSLQHDPDGKHPVSICSLLECIRELHVLQRTDPQESPTIALPVTQAELAQCLAAVQSKRNSDAGAAVGTGAAGRKHCVRSAAALPALGTRGQKNRLMSPQLEAEVAANLQRLSSLRHPSPFTSSPGNSRPGAQEVEASMLYAEELMAVAAEDAHQPTMAQQTAYAELQRLTQYWAEGMFPSASDEEEPPPPPPLSPPHSVSPGPGRESHSWKLPRTRSTPCPVGTAEGTYASASRPYSLTAVLNGGGEASSRSSPQRLSPHRSCT